MKRICPNFFQQQCIKPSTISWGNSHYSVKQICSGLQTKITSPAFAIQKPSYNISSFRNVGSSMSQCSNQSGQYQSGKLKEFRRYEANSKTNIAASKKRFWKEVHVREFGATAIAMEWELLDSALQALKPHMIPLTSLASRALDINDSDNALENSRATRIEIVDSLLRYLDTDSLLCWVPSPPAEIPGYEDHESRVEPLRFLQQRASESILAFLQSRVWPGVKIKPILNEISIIPKAQNSKTREVIRKWVLKLSAWDLAALERGVLAGKGLLIATRLIVEWSENFNHLLQGMTRSFGIEDAADLASLEVEWQTGMWGEVEDTHDVEREDIRRQFGSVVVLVSGK